MAKRVKIKEIAPKIKIIKEIKGRDSSELESDVEGSSPDLSTSSEAHAPILKTDLDRLGRPLPPQEISARTPPVRETETGRPVAYAPARQESTIAYQDPIARAAQSTTTRPRPMATLPENISPRITDQQNNLTPANSSLRESSPFQEDMRYYTPPGEQQQSGKRKRYAWET